MPSERIEGWKAISEYFPFTYSTVKNRHASKMLKAGFVFKSLVDKPHIKKQPIVWTFPELIYAYLSTVQSKKGRV